MLEDEEIRENEGRQLEIIKLATAKSYNKLSQYHTYQDGTVDIPFLTPESVLEQEP